MNNDTPVKQFKPLSEVQAGDEVVIQYEGDIPRIAHVADATELTVRIGFAMEFSRATGKFITGEDIEEDYIRIEAIQNQNDYEQIKNIQWRQKTWHQITGTDYRTLGDDQLRRIAAIVREGK